MTTRYTRTIPGDLPYPTLHHRTGGHGYVQPAQQVQGVRHPPARGRVPRPWTAPTKTATPKHLGGQTDAGASRGKKGPTNALWLTSPSTLQPTHQKTSARSATASWRGKPTTSSPPPSTPSPPTNTTGTHGKAQEKPVQPPLKLCLVENTPHDEWATNYIIPHTTTRKKDAAKITVTRHLPHTTQVYELTAPNVLVTHRRQDQRYTIQVEGTAVTTLYTWTIRGDLPHPTLHHRTGGHRYVHTAQQVQGTRHPPARGRVPRSWTAPTKTATPKHLGGQTDAGASRGKRGPPTRSGPHHRPPFSPTTKRLQHRAPQRPGGAGPPHHHRRPLHPRRPRTPLGPHSHPSDAPATARP